MWRQLQGESPWHILLPGKVYSTCGCSLQIAANANAAAAQAAARAAIAILSAAFVCLLYAFPTEEGMGGTVGGAGNVTNAKP